MTSKTKVSEFLIEAKKLIEEESKWTQGFYAKDKDGTFVDSLSSKAVCYCSVGALLKTRGLRRGTALVWLKAKAESQLRLAMGVSSVPDFNDFNSHFAVMEAWDKAINTAIEEGN